MATTAIMMIAEAGYDVKTCPDDKKVFDSHYKTMKTKATVTIPPNGTPYAHGLGYVPVHLYAGYLEAKPVAIGFIGQNTPDNDTNVQVDDTQLTNDNNGEWGASALVYVFIEQLI